MDAVPGDELQWRLTSAPRIEAPPVTELIAASLGERGCRHLMLLTRHAAALQLLADCALLPAGSADVLFGSVFPEDGSKLVLVQQINRVKHAMAHGRTVVLVNHDNIYEALYDVLNQRYLLKRDPATGPVSDQPQRQPRPTQRG